jgi:SAM-dependent methyltransferase
MESRTLLPPQTLDWPRRRLLAETTRKAILGLRVLPHRPALFYIRANVRAFRLDDRWSFWSSLPPRELSVLVELARGRKTVVELGTGTGWTALVLALAEPERVVRTYDTQVKPHRAAYFALADADARARVLFVEGRGEEAEPPPQPVDLLYVDSNHDREVVRRSFEHWHDSIASGGFAAFDDYVNDNYPGVRAAVSDLGLQGRTAGRLFIWEKT